MSVSISGSPKCSGWFLVGPRYDSMISQQEKCNTDIHQMLVQLGFSSGGEDPAVAGRSDWMRHRCVRTHTHTQTRTHTHTTNLAIQTFHSDCSLVFPHAFFVLWLRSTPHHHPPCVLLLLLACTVRLHLCGCVCVRDRKSFTTHVWLYYAFECARVCVFVRACMRVVPGMAPGPLEGLALTRMSPQAPVLVGCLVLALHVSWLSAVRLYPTLGSLPGGGAILPSPWTSPSPLPPHSPRPPPSSWPTRPEIGRTSSGVPTKRSDSCFYLLHLLWPTLTGLDMHTQDLHWHPNSILH